MMKGKEGEGRREKEREFCICTIMKSPCTLPMLALFLYFYKLSQLLIVCQ